jgi:hypothetical protein
MHDQAGVGPPDRLRNGTLEVGGDDHIRQKILDRGRHVIPSRHQAHRQVVAEVGELDVHTLGQAVECGSQEQDADDRSIPVMRLVASLKFERDMVPLRCSCEAQLCGQLAPVDGGLSVSYVRLASSR